MIHTTIKRVGEND